jgi:hypothetical protein
MYSRKRFMYNEHMELSSFSTLSLAIVGVSQPEKSRYLLQKTA